MQRFGPASQAWETTQEFPQLWGTRRVGPDLARESGKRSRDWHLAHLWNPRWVVPESNMPPHPWLFDGSPLEPTEEALDLVAYLDSLGRGARLSGVFDRSPSGKLDPAEEARMGIFCDCGIPRAAGPAVVFSTDLPAAELRDSSCAGPPSLPVTASAATDQAAREMGPRRSALLPTPRDLARMRFSDLALSTILWEGVPGSSMPRWHELPANDLRALAAYVRSLEADRAQAKPELSAEEQAGAERLYLANCVVCHGTEKHEGTAAGALAPRPTDFRHERPSLGYAENVLEAGVPGTAMPPWRDRLDARQRTLLARYVGSLYQPAAPPSR